MQEEQKPQQIIQIPKQNQGQLDPVSLNHFYKADKPSSCNFCSQGRNIKWAFSQYEKIHPYTLQLMMDHGWVRCGDYYYKSNTQQSCCKKWGIHNNITKFKPKKSQIKTLKKMMKLFAIRQQKKQMMVEKTQKKAEQSKNAIKIQKIVPILTEQQQKFMRDACKQLNEKLKGRIIEKIPKCDGQLNFNIIDKLKLFPSGKGFKGFGYSNYCMLLYGLNKKKFPKQYALNVFLKDIKQLVEEIAKQLKINVQIQQSGYLIFFPNEKIKQMSKSQTMQVQSKKINHQKKKKIRQKQPINNNLNLSQASQKQPVCELTITHNLITFGRLRIQIVRSQIKEDDFHIYQRFSKAVHKKDIQNIQRYVDFLCIDGLHASVKQPLPENNPEGKFYQPIWDPNEQYQKKKPVQKNPKLLQGCYQMKYYLDDKKIAVGFADILPNLYVSDYFFYDPQYRDHRIGVFSALIEIQYVRYMNLCFPQLTHYTMMSYVQSANNMAYKNEFQPMEILCPVTERFIEFTPEIKEKIDKIIKKEIHSVRLAPEEVQINPDIVFEELQMWILQNTNYNYYGRKCKLIELIGEMNVQFVIYLLSMYVPQWGKKVHERLIFEYIDESI